MEDMGWEKSFQNSAILWPSVDVDKNRLELAREIVKGWHGKSPLGAGDYRKIIDDPKIDVVHISTPDHWHAKIAIEAMLAGKDVYCEKPMTLTIEEGRLICDICKKTGAVFQVGTQQRSGPQFIKAIAMIRDGRLGDLRKVECGIGGAPTSPELRFPNRLSPRLGFVARTGPNQRVSF